MVTPERDEWAMTLLQLAVPAAAQSVTQVALGMAG